MKLSRILTAAAFAALTVLSACKKEDTNLGAAFLKTDKTELSLEASSGSATVSITASRNWKAVVADEAKDWLTVSPSSGSAASGAQEVSVKVMENSGYDRTAAITFSIFSGSLSFDSKTVTVTQKGPKGDQSEVDLKNQIKISEFLANKDPKTEYVIGGNVSGLQSEYKSFYINDGTGSVTVYQPSNWDAYASQISSGGMCYAKGKYVEYTDKNGNVIPELVGSIIAYVPAGTEVEEATITDFIAKADISKLYRISGTVSKINKEYMYCFLSDGNGASVELYKPTNWSDFASKIENGAVLTAVGRYEYFEKNSIHEMVEGKIEKVEPPTSVSLSLADAIKASEGTVFDIKGEAYVAAVSAAGFFATDNTNFVYTYTDSVPEVAVGDKVTFTASVEKRNGIINFSKAKNVVKISSGAGIVFPEIKDISENFDAYAATTSEYVSFSGKLETSQSADGKTTYYNIIVDGAKTNTGSVQSPAANLKINDFVGKIVKVTGFYLGVSGGKYQSVIATGIEENTVAKVFTVDDKKVAVDADVTEYSFKVGGNVAWTVETPEGVTATPASGEGEKEVKVSFPANSDITETKEYKITVSTTANVATKSYEVVITQRHGHPADAKAVSFDFKKAIEGWPAAEGVATGDYKHTGSDGTEYSFNISKNGYCNKTDNSYYFFMKAKNLKGDVSLGLPAIEGYRLVQVVISTPKTVGACKFIISSTTADGRTEPTVVKGGEAQNVSNGVVADYIFDLDGTAANTMYYIYNDYGTKSENQKNSQIASLNLVYYKVN